MRHGYLRTLATAAIAIVGVVSVFAVAHAQVWTEPTAPPPSGNPPGFVWLQGGTTSVQNGNIHVSGAGKFNELQINPNTGFFPPFTVFKREQLDHWSSPGSKVSIWPGEFELLSGYDGQYYGEVRGYGGLQLSTYTPGNDSPTAWYPRLRIDGPSGNVGIGTAPDTTHRLLVDGKISATELCIGDSSVAANCRASWAPDVTSVRLQGTPPSSADVGSLWVQDEARAGNVKIVGNGTQATLGAPVSTFYVDGNGNVQIRIDADATVGENAEFRVNNGANSSIFRLDESGNVVLGGLASQIQVGLRGVADNLRIGSTGDVNIKLDDDNNSGPHYFRVIGGAITDPVRLYISEHGEFRFKTQDGVGGGGDLLYGVADPDPYPNGTGGQQRLGVGVFAVNTYPQALLHVKGDTLVDGNLTAHALTLKGDGSIQNQANLDAEANNFYVNANGDVQIRLDADSAEDGVDVPHVFSIANELNRTMFVIDEYANAGFLLYNGVESASISSFTISGGAGGQFRVNELGELTLDVLNEALDAGGRLLTAKVVDGNQRLGVGAFTSASLPQALLHVKGDAKIDTSLQTQSLNATTASITGTLNIGLQSAENTATVQPNSDTICVASCQQSNQRLLGGGCRLDNEGGFSSEMRLMASSPTLSNPGTQWQCVYKNTGSIATVTATCTAICARLAF